MTHSVKLEWELEDGEKKSHTLLLLHPSMLASHEFLQGLLPSFRTLIAVKAILDNGEVVDIIGHRNMDGERNYLLDSTFSNTYMLICIIDLVGDNEESSSVDVSFQAHLKDCHNEGEDTFKIPCVDVCRSSSFDSYTQEETPSAFQPNESANIEPSTDTTYVDKSSTFEFESDGGANIQPSGDTASGDDCTISESILNVIQFKEQPCLLKTMIERVSQVVQVLEIPRQYDGDSIMEFPPTFGKTGNMDGMEQKYDGHLWTRPVTSNMAIQCTVRVSYCIGALECHRINCPFYLSHKRFNNTFFHGHLGKKIATGLLAEDDRSKIVCHFCRKIAYSVQMCKCVVYYVMPKDTSVTRMILHLGVHDHPVQPGTSRAMIEQVRRSVSIMLKGQRNAGPRKLQMDIVKDILFSYMSKNEDISLDVGDHELCLFLEELSPLIEDQRFRRIVYQEKRKLMPTGEGFDSILLLQRRSRYSFFQGSLFPGQGGPEDKCYIFKMSVRGPASGVDLVNRMRRGSGADLATSWVLFDHTHRVLGWSTMACHVYDPSVQELLTIATCEMKEEDTKSQVLFWEKLNSTMQQCGYHAADFHGFMADEAGANWCAVRTVFNGGPTNIMEDRERTCLFHWKQSLYKHTKKCVKKESQQKHITLCEEWRLATSKETALCKSKEIRQWWRKGHAEKGKVTLLDTWMSWWEERIAHWGNLMSRVVLSQEEIAQTPRTNLAESVHGSWLAGEGYKEKISLYDACISDMANALLQSAKQYAYQMGKHKGEGPSLSKLMDRVASRSIPTPPQVARIVQQVVAGTPMYEESRPLHGDKETIQRKRGRPIEIERCSHKPGYAMDTKHRTSKGPIPRRVSFEGANPIKTPNTKDFHKGQQRPTGVHYEGHQDHPKMPEEIHKEITDDGSTKGTKNMQVMEDSIARPMWAIRRTPLNSKVKCLGVIDGKNKCNAYIQGSSTGVVAPSFFSERRHPGPGGPKPQMMWFCPSDVSHTWHVDPNIVYKPAYPDVWKVDVGTNITSQEIEKLLASGFTLDVKLNEGAMASSTQTARSKTNIGKAVNHPASSSKRSTKWRHSISQEAEKRISKAESMQAVVINVSAMNPAPHSIFHLACESGQEYFVHIKENPWCTCPDFMDRETKGKSYLACKHIYFVYLRVLGLHKLKDMGIHQPTLSQEDVSRMLSNPLNIAVCAHM